MNHAEFHAAVQALAGPLVYCSTHVEVTSQSDYAAVDPRVRTTIVWCAYTERSGHVKGPTPEAVLQALVKPVLLPEIDPPPEATEPAP